MSNLKLDFAIVGVQKAGTTALAHYLGQHPGVFLPPAKETHFFRRKPRADGPADRPFEHLTRHYDTARPGQLLGDATPNYLYWPHALDLLSAHNPDLRLIVSLRHPVMRAWSAWSMEKRRGREMLAFSDAIRDGRRRVADAPHGVHLIYAYVERGFYGAQIETLLSLFPRQQVFFLRNDEITHDAPALQRLQAFLGLDPVTLSPITENVNPGSLEPSAQAREDFLYLQDLYADDIRLTTRLSELDLSDWAHVPALTPTGAVAS